ncbi:MAG: hypothetical protein VXW65_00490 [Pseudomonadota bacterium]|nr:hypothetical protein [Pseudomonadota bacterium]
METVGLLRPAAALAILSSGVLLVLGLLAGVWKYALISRAPRGRAPYYVDITHRAALLYAFAALVLAALAQVSVWSESVNLWAVGLNLVYFLAAIFSYALHGVLKDTDNQFRRPHQLGKLTLPSVLLHGFMGSLIIAEIGGTLVLLSGAWQALWPLIWQI